VDEAGSRVLVLDSQLRALIEINLITSEHTVISDDLTPNDLTSFANPQRIAVSALGDKAWIIDRGYEDLIVVDLATGSRSLLVDTTSTDVSESLVDARDIALDEISSNALILAGGSDGINDFETRVISIDLADGARFVLSDGLTPNADNPLEDNPFDMSVVFDSVGFRLLVMQRGDLLSVDPLTGHRSVFSDTGVGGAVDATHDALNNRVLVVNRVNSTLYGANLNSGDVQSIWPLNIGGFPARIASDPFNNRVLVLYKNRREVFATNLLTGEASIAY
jgi:DNA-binding beta-propeller fold protein YncE